jgi:chemotaxis-related protein WspB
MLFVLFRLGHEHYALDVGQVAEVLPLVRITPIPRAPPGLAGAFNYRGAPVPVVDLSMLALGRKSDARLSTRIIVVHYPIEPGGKRLLGLIAEHAIETVRRDEADFVPSGVTNASAPYLGPVIADERGLVHRVEVDRLLTPSVRDVLFTHPLEA